MNFQFSEDDLEQVALEWFEGLGYTIKNGREISDKGITPERESDKDVVLDNRLEAALRRINLIYTTMLLNRLSVKYQ